MQPHDKPDPGPRSEAADALDLCAKLREELAEIQRTTQLERAVADDERLFALGAHLQYAQGIVDDLDSLLASLLASRLDEREGER